MDQAKRTHHHEVMREVVIDVSVTGPKTLSMEMLEQADRVVTMGWKRSTPPALWRRRTGRSTPEGQADRGFQADQG